MIPSPKKEVKPLHIGIVAGEPSGDLLGGGLIRALRKAHPNAFIEGIGGTHMLAAGFHTHYPLETLSVMGLVEVLKHISYLKKCRDQLCQHLLQNPPDVFIGIDAPDFNLGLERTLKAANIPTVHYVSPSVWAWRQYRLRKIRQACNQMLTLFPFEADYYQRHHIPVKFVGHPLADAIPLQTDKRLARIHLNLTEKTTWIAILPGSRQTEIRQLSVPFLQTAQWLLQRDSTIKFIVPLVNPKIKFLFSQQLEKFAVPLPITLLTGQAQEAMAAADVVLLASGTATLEAMLLKRPMVVAYRLTPITYWLAKMLVRTPFFALPNLLAQKMLVPEYLQSQVTAEQLGTAILHWLEQPLAVETLQAQFLTLHQQLRQEADCQVAQAVLSLINKESN